jgi:alkylhydroperoxidase family enzyme
MSWITEPELAPDEIEELARKQADQQPGRTRNGGGGRLGPIMSVMSLNPRALQGVRNMNSAITFGSSALTRVQEEAIATTVSAANECRY